MATEKPVHYEKKLYLKKYFVFVLHEIYHKYDTILASSASAERLFSKGKLVFNTKRHSLHDDHFEQQLVWNCIKDLL